MKASIRQLRSSTREILGAVSRGDIVWVTSRGKTCAKITPVRSSAPTELKDEAFGMWKDRKDIHDVRAYVRQMRKWRRVD